MKGKSEKKAHEKAHIIKNTAFMLKSCLDNCNKKATVSPISLKEIGNGCFFIRDYVAQNG